MLIYVSLALGGLLLGALLSWLIAAGRSKGVIVELRAQNQKATEELERLRQELAQESGARIRAETQLQEMLQRLAEEKKLLEEAETRLTDTFKALSGEALKSNNEEFLKLVKATVLAEAKTDLDQRKEAISNLVKPLDEKLKQYEEHVRNLEVSRQKAYTQLEEQLKSMTVTQQALQKETGNLVTALRTPQVRGRWGEMTLRRAAELAGMSEHCDFTEQVSIDTEDGRLRPDLIVHLPAGREIVVDAKVPLDAYLRAIEAETDELRQKALNDHARQVRDHMKNLGNKAYWKQFEQAPEFVVLFIPGENFFSAAVDRDRTLIEDGMAMQVIVATPTTLVALLRAVAFGWLQEQLAKNAQEISNLGKQMFERMQVLATHLSDIGRGLEKACTSYNKAVGSMESRVFPSARKFADLGVGSGSEIPLIEPVETTLREVNLPETKE